MQREQVRIGFQSLFSWLLSGSLISPTGKVSFFEWQLCEGPSKGHTTEKMERGKKWSTRQNSNPLPLDWQACGQPLCFNCSSMITMRRRRRRSLRSPTFPEQTISSCNDIVSNDFSPKYNWLEKFFTSHVDFKTNRYRYGRLSYFSNFYNWARCCCWLSKGQTEKLRELWNTFISRSL